MPPILILLALFPAQEPEDRLRQALQTDPRVLVRELAADGIAGNAERAWQELLKRGASAHLALAAGLESADPQQRFLSASALAHLQPSPGQVPAICAILWPHLEANAVPGDLEMAQCALAALGSGKHWLEFSAWWREAQRTSGGQATAALLGVGLRLGFHRDWSGSHPWPSARPRFTLRADAAWPMLQPRSTSWGVDRRATEMIHQLGSDRVGRNASHAMIELGRRIGEPAVRKALRRALFDLDHQRRQYVWAIWIYALFPYWGQGEAIPEEEIPWGALDQMAAEALRQDQIGYRSAGWGNASLACHYFEQRGRAAWPVLRRAVLSDDVAQRVRAAVLRIVLDDPHAGDAIGVLCAAMRDNRVANDCAAARYALLGAGQAARSWLDAAGPALDGQERRTRAWVLGRLEEQTKEQQQRARLDALHRLSTVSRDRG